MNHTPTKIIPLSSQKKIVLNHLQHRGPITALEGLKKYGIMRLSARIHELRDAGFEILTVPIKFINNDGVKKKVAQYILISSRRREKEWIKLS